MTQFPHSPSATDVEADVDVQHAIGDHSAFDDHDDFGGFQRDLHALLPRRRALSLLGGLSLAGLVAACGGGSSESGAATTTSSTAATDTSSDSGTSSTSGSTSTTETTATSTTETPSGDGAVTASAGDEIPDETAGPFPSDGSNGPNILSESDVVRTDITSSIGSMSGTAEGVPTTVSMTVVDADTGSPLPGAAVYLWHCTAEGKYSIYEISDQNYLRGVAVADDAGRVDFTTIFPGCYRGRWPHCHFEVFDSVDAATAGNQARKTSQLAVPQADCEAVYSADSRYGSSIDNLGQLSLNTDNVFRDGWEDQLAVASGSVDGGYTLSLLVRV